MTSLIVSTWAFSRPGVEEAAKQLQTGQPALQAVEAGIKVVEEDPTVTSVGYGGLPNALGHLQLDAALMTSAGQQGSVMGLQGFGTAIPAASAVLQHSRHPILCGSGAVDFAIAHGLPHSPNQHLLTAHASQRYRKFQDGLLNPGPHRSANSMPHSDTVGMLALDGGGALAAGCATSGMQFKHQGRVGDSPVFGAGLYADAPGCAVATGDGDRMVRFCPSFLIVERMRLGDSPQLACRAAVSRILDGCPDCQAAVLAVDSNGCVGAAASQNGFCFVRWNRDSGVSVVDVEGLRSTSWTHSCA